METLVHLDEQQIESIIPHRKPFRFIDEADVVFGKRGLAKLNMTVEEYEFLSGHFPGNLLVPGVLLAEALAQLGGIVVCGLPEYSTKFPALSGLDRWRFRHFVRTGEQSVDLEVQSLRMRSNFGKGYGRAIVGDQIAAEGEIHFSLIDKPVDHGRVE